jgi:hypothetical protein
MNQRIKLLAEQAGAVFTNSHAASLLDDEMEKFAELIVKECAEVVKWTPSMFPNDTIIKNIKEHFGVE